MAKKHAKPAESVVEEKVGTLAERRLKRQQDPNRIREAPFAEVEGDESANNQKGNK